MNLMAIVQAYDPTSPAAQSRDEFRQQALLLFQKAEPLIPLVQPLIGKQTRQYDPQSAFDALLSIALDMGSDSFLMSEVPSLIRDKASKKRLTDAICSLPVTDNSLRPELTEQLYRYRIIKPGEAIPSRRHFEARLYFGIPYFTITPVRRNARVQSFTPQVLHPFFLFR